MKSIYDEAKKVVTYLQEQNSHLKDNCGTIYVSTENITTLGNLLIHSHKQEKLLELYKQINIIYVYIIERWQINEMVGVK